jgi:methionyl-tRNA formyltransferase
LRMREATATTAAANSDGKSPLRVVVLTHGAAELILEKLARLKTIEIVGVFLETETARQRSLREKLRRSIRYDGWAATLKKVFAPISRAKTAGAQEEQTIAERQNSTAETAAKLKIPVHFVSDLHSAEAMDLLRAASADLGLLCGTNIIKETVFSIPRLGSINLHQGLAPYYRGGPSVFWELFNDEKEVGLTVHWVAAKVDTGDIIRQTTVPLRYDFSFGADYEKFIDRFLETTREPCAELIAEAVRMIAAGEVVSTPQDATLGKRYRLPVKREKDEMRRRLRERMKAQTAQVRANEQSVTN